MPLDKRASDDLKAASREVVLFYAGELRQMAGRAERFAVQLEQYDHADVAEQLRMAGLALGSIADRLEASNA